MQTLDEKIPDEFLCKITLCLMEDPVIDIDGHSYENEAILSWLKREQTSPMTRKPMDASSLRPNRDLKDAIQSWLNSTKEHQKEALAHSQREAEHTEQKKQLEIQLQQKEEQYSQLQQQMQSIVATIQRKPQTVLTTQNYNSEATLSNIAEVTVHDQTNNQFITVKLIEPSASPDESKEFKAETVLSSKARIFAAGSSSLSYQQSQSSVNAEAGQAVINDYSASDENPPSIRSLVPSAPPYELFTQTTSVELSSTSKMLGLLNSSPADHALSECKEDNRNNHQKMEWDEKLIDAINRNDINAVEVALEKGADIHLRDCHGNSVLHMVFNEAIQKEILEINIQEVISIANTKEKWKDYIEWDNRKFILNQEYRANILKKAKERLDLEQWEQSEEYKEQFFNLLVYCEIASKNTHRKIILSLILKGADLNALNNNKETPLFNAVMTGDSLDVMTLLIYGASPNHQDNYGFTPMHVAARINKINELKTLWFYGANDKIVDKAEKTITMVAHECGNQDIATFINEYTERKVVMDSCRNQAMQYQRTKSLPFVKSTTLYAAIRELRRVVDSITNLSERSDDEKIKSCKELVIALFTQLWGHVESHDITRRESRKKLRDNSYMPIRIVTTKQQDNELLWAAQNGSILDIKQAVKKGERFSQHDKEKNNALHFAVYHGHEEVVTYLIMNQVKVNEKNIYGKTPLHIAAEMGFNKIIIILLESGANIDVKSGNGNTPLHYAAYSGNEKALHYLLMHGADINILNNADQYAFDIVVQRCHHKSLVVMMAHGKNNVIKLSELRQDARREWEHQSFHLAAEMGDHIMILIFLAAFYDPNIYSITNNIAFIGTIQPLGVAAITGNYNIISELIAFGADLEKFNNMYIFENYTALGWAFDQANFENVIGLLLFNANSERIPHISDLSDYSLRYSKKSRDITNVLNYSFFAKENNKKNNKLMREEELALSCCRVC